MKTSLRVNHTVVPLCLASRAMLKLTDGSGGESHFVIIFCRVWLAVGMFELLHARHVTGSPTIDGQDAKVVCYLSNRLDA